MIYYITFVSLSGNRIGDTDKNITILKLDIEGEEMWSIPQILKTKVLSNIKQIHIEVR